MSAATPSSAGGAGEKTGTPSRRPADTAPHRHRWGAREAGAQAPPALRLLVVEDEMLIALLIEQMLRDLGYVVVGPVNGVAPALRLLENEAAGIDGAVLDVNLNGEPVYPVADTLRARGLPFAFVTGYAAAGIASRYAGVPVLQKPFRPEQLERLVSVALTREDQTPEQR